MGLTLFLFLLYYFLHIMVVKEEQDTEEIHQIQGLILVQVVYKK